MSLIIYPLENYDSFLEVAECITLSDNYIPNNKFAQLADDTSKEVILRQTALQIKQCKNITLPDDTTNDLEMAQVYLVEQALSTDMVAYDSNDGAVQSETAGSVSMSYFKGEKLSNTSFPPMVVSLLSQYGCKQSNGKFSQSYASRS